MSAMRDMSRAIRHELTDAGRTIQEIPTSELQECIAILRAFTVDLQEEMNRRAAAIASKIPEES